VCDDGGSSCASTPPTIAFELTMHAHCIAAVTGLPAACGSMLLFTTACRAVCCFLGSKNLMMQGRNLARCHV
jgi:hypothetical protein